MHEISLVERTVERVGSAGPALIGAETSLVANDGGASGEPHEVHQGVEDQEQEEVGPVTANVPYGSNSS
jgi:hypothetical protein